MRLIYIIYMFIVTLTHNNGVADTVCCCYWKRKTQWLRSCLSHSSLSLPNFTVSFLVFLFLYFPLHLFIFHYLSSATVWFKQCNVALHSSVPISLISSVFSVCWFEFCFALIAFGFVCVGERDSKENLNFSFNCYLILLNITFVF